MEKNVKNRIIKEARQHLDAARLDTYKLLQDVKKELLLNKYQKYV